MNELDEKIKTLEQSIEEREKWAEYYAAVLRAAKFTEAADWLKKTHAPLDIVDFIQEKLDSIPNHAVD